MVKRALKEQKDDDYSWTVCLVDCDNHETLQDAFRLATEEDIRVLASNPCFELWLLWHLENWRHHSSSRDVQARLAKPRALQDKSLTSSFPIGRYADARAHSDKASPEHLVNHPGLNPSSPIPVPLELLGIWASPVRELTDVPGGWKNPPEQHLSPGAPTLRPRWQVEAEQ